jgi:hypothetical protein
MDASPAPLSVPPEAAGLVGNGAADAAFDGLSADDDAHDDDGDDDDGPTLPPSGVEALAQAHAEDVLAGLKPERPDITFPRSDEVTISASITELDELSSPTPPPPPPPSSRPPPEFVDPDPAAPPPPAPGAPLPPMPEGNADVPDFSGDEDYDRTLVQAPMAEDLAVGVDDDDDDDELIVDDEELFEEEP